MELPKDMNHDDEFKKKKCHKRAKRFETIEKCK